MITAAVAGGRQRPPVYSAAGAMLLALSLVGCDLLPGRTRARDQGQTAPTQVATFYALYNQQCAGCHGRDGRLQVGVGIRVLLAL